MFQHVGLEFRWFCRKMDDGLTEEAFPVDLNGDLYYNATELLNIPETKQNDTSGGCFGDGPGPKIIFLYNTFKLSIEPFFFFVTHRCS
jgi:hypothetical protein